MFLKKCYKLKFYFTYCGSHIVENMVLYSQTLRDEHVFGHVALKQGFGFRQLLGKLSGCLDAKCCAMFISHPARLAAES